MLQNVLKACPEGGFQHAAKSFYNLKYWVAHGPTGPRAHGPPVAKPSGCQPLRLPSFLLPNPPVANPSDKHLA